MHYPKGLVHLFIWMVGDILKKAEFLSVLERSPVIAAVRDDSFDKALSSPCEIIFYLKANILTIKDRAEEAIKAGKILFVHIDLADGIGKDKSGIEFLSKCGISGIISTRNQLISIARDIGLLTVQRFFALDSQGLDSIREVSNISCADLLEIMPGVIPKVIEKFAEKNIDVIAGGLIETKAEVLTALQSSASAVSTGKSELWYI